MMHHFNTDGLCRVCNEIKDLNTQHLCAECFSGNALPYNNDNRNDLAKNMSPCGAALFSCFQSSDAMEQKKALDNLNEVLSKRVK